MKVIIVSDALDEPYELDSTKDTGVMGFVWLVKDQVEAVLGTEQIKAAAHQHGILGR